jgi:hypothetical protein
MRAASAAATLTLLQKRGSSAVLLPEFMREVYVGQRTGLLHVTRGDDEARVSFRAVNGEIVSGSSSNERGRLGDTLVRWGVLTCEDLDRALAIVQQQGRRLAPVLRELDLLDTAGLEQALALHIREMLMTALQWDEAWLLFEDQELPDAPAEDLTLRCSTADLILELARRIPRGDAVRRGLGSLDRRMVAVPEPPFRLEQVSVSPADRYVLSRADGRSSARELIAAAKLPVEHVERSLLGLLLTGALRALPAGPPLPHAVFRVASPPAVVARRR